MPITARKPSQKLLDLVGTLNGKWNGPNAMCLCPAHADASPSLSIRQGDKGILVHCFAGCASEDVLRELRRIRADRHFERPKPYHFHGSGLLAGRIWGEGRPVEGTLAERYLASRGLDTRFADLRFHSRCAKGRKPLTVFSPALLIAVRDGTNLCAIQRIFLDPSTKHYTEKLMIGAPGAGSWRGSPVTDTLALAEGFETAAAFTQIHNIPCWASLSGSRLDRLQLPKGIRKLILAEDNDEPGRRAAAKAWTAYNGNDFTMRRMAPPERFGDWADVLKDQ